MGTSVRWKNQQRHRPSDQCPVVVLNVPQFVTVIAGACWYQLAIRDDTCGPELKSTRSQPVPDHVRME
jgi:hypothetical protein